MSKQTLTLYLKLPHDPVGAGNREDEDDGTFKYEATVHDAVDWVDSLGLDVRLSFWERICMTPVYTDVQKRFMDNLAEWLESDPSLFAISGDTAVKM